MREKRRALQIIAIAFVCLALTGCSLESKVRFLSVSLQETVLFLRAANDVWVNDNVNEQYYEIDNFSVGFDNLEFEKTDNIEGYTLNLEFRTFYFGRYYHLQLYQKENTYIVATICYTAGKNIPLKYSKQSYFICSQDFVEELLALRLKIDK